MNLLAEMKAKLMKNETKLHTDIDQTEEVVEQEPPSAIDALSRLKSFRLQKPKISSAPQQDFSADQNIPTLDEIALPGNKVTHDKNTAGIPIPRHLLKPDSGKKDLAVTPELIDKLNHELQIALIPEIEKAISFALNNALATVMDHASRTTKARVRERIEKLLPKLIEQHLARIADEDDNP
jgi:hypothetical protein